MKPETEKKYTAIICNFSNWIVAEMEISLNQDIPGYSAAKRKEADHYALVRRNGSEITVKTLWLKKI